MPLFGIFTRRRTFEATSSRGAVRPLDMRAAARLLLSAVFGLALLEIVGRVFDPLGISYYPETARFLDTMIWEEPIGSAIDPI